MKLFAGSTDDTTTTTESNNKESSPSSEDNNNNEAIEAKAKAQASAIRLIEFEKKKGLRQKSLEFNSSRAQYAKQVTKLRHKYKLEVETHQAQDLSIQQAEKELTLRRRLERQRSKNERSLENALRQKELKRQQSLAYEDHIKVQHDIRVSKELIQKRAQQLLIHDLENESKEWLTTVDEVETVFNDAKVEQLLWTKPQGYVGVSNPSLDSHYWFYEGHTWDRSKTYKTKSEILLKRLEDEAYNITNIDTNIVWTINKENEYNTLLNKAKLRSLVRQAGRRSLLQKQKNFLESNDLEEIEGEIPKPKPIPSLGVLADIKAQEKEGSEILLNDPTKFFIFEGNNNNNNSSNGGGDDDSSNESYSGSSLGKPIDIRDPLRTGQPQGRVFPIPIGKLPKADLRTEKEKKRQEREERLWAAANVNKETEDDDALIAEEDRVFGEEIDYEEANENWDSDDEEWNKGLDSDSPVDSKILNVPREYRYRDNDIDEVIIQLEKKASIMQSHVSNSIKTMEQEARSRIIDNDGVVGGGNGNVVSAAVDDNTHSEDTTDDDDDDDAPFFDEETTKQLLNVGADVEKYEKLMSSLSREQLLSMFALEGKEIDNMMNTKNKDGSDGISDNNSNDDNNDVTSTKVFEEIPGLTEQQIIELTELESFIRIAEKQN
jgi:hypothetical protein